MKKVELLAPAGNMEKLKTAIHFGADAVYLAGKQFGLRAFAGNFSMEELKEATDYVHERGKKIYITVNVFAKNADLEKAAEYFVYLQSIEIDAVIITDAGLISIAKKVAPRLELHLSTQANTTNKATVRFWGEQGISRVVLARELSFSDIREIMDYNESVEIEMFIHGAMCISYSGRCLLSNYLSKRDSNRGECVQACRWEYKLHEVNKSDKPLTIQEDERGTYLLNSKDLCLLGHIEEIILSGVASLKIEGRMKSEYYVAGVVNAYRRAIDAVEGGVFSSALRNTLKNGLERTSHREFTTAYFQNENSDTEYFEASIPAQTSMFIATVIDYDNKRGLLEVEMRNRFKKGDVLQVLAAGEHDGKILEISRMYDSELCEISDAYLVQQKVYIETNFNLKKYDILLK